eukprot:GDKJ01014580.1.p1 GENE.GDKJ01014580.1~~GDKJ01014580.1.p1  ORF type:complete len:285 (-),score=49.98 GDKJ01014580.1:65-919(-)
MAGAHKMPTELLECGLCLDLMIPPIFQCEDGHTFCNTCKEKLTTCPVCRSSVINIRCRALEKIVETIGEVECRFAKYGCKSVVPYFEKKNHEAKCQHRSIACFHLGCTFEGSSEELAFHLRDNHEYTIFNTHEIDFECNSENVSLKFSGAAGDDVTDSAAEEEWVWQKQIYFCYNKYYVLRIHRKAEYDTQLFISVAALTSRHHPNRYSVSAVGNYRQYTFEGPVWSICKGFKEVERVRDCLMIPMNIAFFLSGGKGSEKDMSVLKLKIRGVIHPNTRSTPLNH